MADRYWVGGTATWDGTAGTKWATASGGLGGASAPTSADNVFFDASSGVVIVSIGAIVSCLGFDCTGYTGTISAGSNLTVNGSFILSSGMTWNGAVTLAGSATRTVNTAGKSLSQLTLNGVGSTCNLASAITVNGFLQITNGTFNTNNYTVTVFNFLSGTAGTRTINLGSSTVVASTQWQLANTAGLTFSAGTSNITLSGATFTSDTRSYYNFNFSSTSSVSISSITGSTSTLTFNDLSIAGVPSANTLRTVTVGADIVVNGVLTLPTASASPTQRTSFQSATGQTTQTITVNSLSASPVDVDFRGLTFSGAVTPISGTRLGNRGNVSGVTFPASRTVYYAGTGSSTFASSTPNWSSTSGGPATSADFPLPQDNIVFINGFPSSGSTISGTGNYAVSNVDFSARTQTLTITANFYTLGNWTGSSSVTSYLYASGIGSQNVLSSGGTFSSVTMDKPATSVFSLGDAIVCTGAFSLGSGGTFVPNNYNVTASNVLYSSNTATKTINLGAGTWTITGSGTAWNSLSPLGVTLNRNTATITMTSASPKTFSGGGLVYPTLNQGGSGALTIAGSNTFANLTATTLPSTITITSGSTQTFENFTLSGAAGSLVTVAPSSTTNYSFVKTGASSINVDYLSISRCTATPSTVTWYVGANSVDGGNNTGLIFTANPSAGTTLSFAITENPDSASIGITAETSAALSANDPPDTAAFNLTAADSAGFRVGGPYVIDAFLISGVAELYNVRHRTQ